jgi:hypothetical protein
MFSLLNVVLISVAIGSFISWLLDDDDDDDDDGEFAGLPA